MVKRILAAYALVSLITFAIAVMPVKAHVLKQNNGVYSVMHIAPDDNPQAGKLTTVVFEFGANQGVFHLNDCDCQLELVENGQVLATVPLEPAFVGTNSQAIGKVTFPKIDVYDLKVTGKSKAKQFSNFSLDYPIRVASSVRPDNQKNLARNDTIAVLVVSVVSVGVVSAIAYLQIKHGNRYKLAGKKTSKKR